MSRLNPNQNNSPALPPEPVKVAPVDTRQRVQSTHLPEVVATLHAAGKRVLRMDTERDRRSTKTDYLLTVADSGAWRWFKPS